MHFIRWIGVLTEHLGMQIDQELADTVIVGKLQTSADIPTEENGSAGHLAGNNEASGDQNNDFSGEERDAVGSLPHSANELQSSGDIHEEEEDDDDDDQRPESELGEEEVDESFYTSAVLFEVEALPEYKAIENMELAEDIDSRRYDVNIIRIATPLSM